MKVHRNEMIAPREVSVIHDTYKEDTELGDSLTAKIGSNSSGIPNDDAATGVMKKPFAQDLGVLEKFRETMEILNSSDPEKKIIINDLGVLKKLKEVMELLNSSDDGKKIITEDSGLLKKLKETIERINSSEWSLAGIRELIDKFSTTTQFDLQGISNVEENMKDQNLNLEIGEFSLVRVMEKAREALHGGANTDSDAIKSFQESLKQEAEGSGGNTNYTSDSGAPVNYDLLNVEA